MLIIEVLLRQNKEMLLLFLTRLKFLKCDKMTQIVVKTLEIYFSLTIKRNLKFFNGIRKQIVLNLVDK